MRLAIAVPFRSYPGSALAPDASAELMTVGESVRDESLDLTELAAYASLANAVFCTDEAITRN